MLRVVIASLACSSVAALCVAQDSNVRLVGRVVDQTGSQLPGVAIVATSGNLKREVTVQGDGNYEIQDMTPGAYTITASLTGFRTETKYLDFGSSESAIADFAL